MHEVRNRIWLAAIVCVTLLMGLLYVTIQQTLRVSANDPQHSMAKDAAYAIEHGGKPTTWNEDVAIDMALSEAPFIIIYDKAGNVVAGNGTLEGEIPKVPHGVLEHATAKGEDVITWEPSPTVRIASVTVPVGDYYVLSGRSLFAIERQIGAAGQWLAGIWLVVMVAVCIVYLAANVDRKPRSL